MTDEAKLREIATALCAANGENPEHMERLSYASYTHSNEGRAPSSVMVDGLSPPRWEHYLPQAKRLVDAGYALARRSPDIWEEAAKVADEYAAIWSNGAQSAESNAPSVRVGAGKEIAAAIRARYSSSEKLHGAA